MPLYDFRCPEHGVFEQYASREEAVVYHVCGQTARRMPFSGIPNLQGETVARSIPDPSYRHEAQKRELNRTWGDASRSVEMLRKASFTDEKGEKAIDMKRMSA